MSNQKTNWLRAIGLLAAHPAQLHWALLPNLARQLNVCGGLRRETCVNTFLPTHFCTTLGRNLQLLRAAASCIEEP